MAAVRLATIQPMYYAGPALQTRDEIESQVVVDFEAAFGIEPWRPELETLIGSEIGDDPKIKSSKCDADCCTHQFVHDDSYVETKRNEEFMGHLLPKTREDMPSVAIIPRPLDAKMPEARLTEERKTRAMGSQEMAPKSLKQCLTNLSCQADTRI